MSKTMIVIAKLKYDGNRKIESIKLLRQAIGIGLMSAKEAIEAAGTFGVTNIRITATQFGRLKALIETNAQRSEYGLEVTAIAIEGEKPLCRDLVPIEEE